MTPDAPGSLVPDPPATAASDPPATAAFDAPDTADPDRAPAAADVVRLWPLSRQVGAARRVVAFLRRLDGEGALQYTVGTRNRRLLALRRSLVPRPIEAQVACPGCGTDNEFVLPADAVTAAAPVPAGARVRLEVDGRTHTFRLPVLADLTSDGDGPPVADLADLAARTCLDPPAPALTPDDVDRLAQAWDTLDPAGSVRIDLQCVGCRRTVAADADPAAFVASDLDLLVDRLLREVDLLAHRYGWSEQAILALPPARRDRYLQFATGAHAPDRAGADAPRPARRTRR